jgi:hypothetical protein
MMLSENNIKGFIENLSHLGNKDTSFLSGVIHSYLCANELRISSIALEMEGSYEANYKALQRFLDRIEVGDIKEILGRFSPKEFPFVILDPSEIQRPQARKTNYVGFLIKRTARQGDFL